jgi:hypothetical protein
VVIEARQVTLFGNGLSEGRRLGLDLASLVMPIRQNIGEELIGPWAEFLKRHEKDKGLDVMAYKASSDNGGFRYVRNW